METQAVITSITKNQELLDRFEELDPHKNKTFGEIQQQVLPQFRGMKNYKKRVRQAHDLYKAGATLSIGTHLHSAVSKFLHPDSVQQRIKELSALAGGLVFKPWYAIGQDGETLFTSYLYTARDAIVKGAAKKHFWVRFHAPLDVEGYIYERGLLDYSRCLLVQHESERREYSRSRQIRQVPCSLFVTKYERMAPSSKSELAAHTDDNSGGTVLFCLKQHAGDNGSLHVRDTKDQTAKDFRSYEYDQTAAVVMSPYVVHRVDPPTHDERLVIGIFW
eukprot:GDKI01040846.1.p1 GENE.GDKI01040846.1~~GDKI01040846.1.p1  ORF type:complete len:276 (+),score=17.95 GDKI01040846.1:169-996(+)